MYLRKLNIFRNSGKVVKNIKCVVVKEFENVKFLIRKWFEKEIGSLIVIVINVIICNFREDRFLLKFLIIVLVILVI